MFRGYDGGVVLSYETADGGRQSQPKADPPLAEMVRGHLGFERVRQYYAEIEQLQKEIDEVKERLKGAVKGR